MEKVGNDGNLMERLREELLKLGYTKTQVNSQVVHGVLSIVAKNSEYLDIAEIEKAKKFQQTKLADLEWSVSCEKEKIEELKKKREMLIEHIDKIFDEMCGVSVEYIKKFLDTIKECETPEGRDAIRVAQMFVNSVQVDTKYDNTAFIIGLSSILSNWNTGAIDELRKINTKIPDVKKIKAKYVSVRI